MGLISNGDVFEYLCFISKRFRCNFNFNLINFDILKYHGFKAAWIERHDRYYDFAGEIEFLNVS